MLLAPLQRERTIFRATRHVPWAQYTPKKRFGIHLELANVSDGCTCPISVKRSLKIKANVPVAEYIVCYRVVAY